MSQPAAKGGYDTIMTLLLDTGKGDVDSKDSKYGRTSLRSAVKGGHDIIATLLLDYWKGVRLGGEGVSFLRLIRSTICPS